MDSQSIRNLQFQDSASKSFYKQQSVRPKNWNKFPRKSGKLAGVIKGTPGRVEKHKIKTRNGFDAPVLSNVPENSILESFVDREQKFDLSDDFRSNGYVVPFKTIEPSQFSHTFPKPIGWGRKKMDLGKTVNLDNGASMGYRNYNELESCLGILHSKMDPIKRPECAFCKRNNAKDYFHILKDELGGVVCPVLSAFTCKMCAATGRNAHTHKYCPVNPITKGDPVAAGMPPGRPLTKEDKEWLKYFHTKFLMQLLEGSRNQAR